MYSGGGVFVETAKEAEEREHPSIFVEHFFHLIVVVFLFAGLLWKQTGMTYLSVLLLIMINGSRLWCRLSLRKVSSRLTPDRSKVFPGEKVVLDGEMKGSGFLPVWLRIEAQLSEGLSATLSEGSGREADGGGHALILGNRLFWRDKLTWAWNLTPLKRGCYQVGPLYLESSDLLGFFRQKKEIRLSFYLTVFPRIVSINRLPLPFEELFGRQGAKGSVVDPVYPVATRDYQPGRPARYIHWKASLRLNRLQERIFEPTSRKKVLLAIDVEEFRETGDEYDFEALLEVAATLALRLNTEGSSIGLLTNGVTFPTVPAILPFLRGEAHLQSLMEGLAVLKMEKKQSFAALFKQSQEFYRGGSCYYFAGGNGNFEEIAALFKLYHIPVIFILGNSRADVAGHIPAWMAKRVFRLKDVHSGSEAVV